MSKSEEVNNTWLSRDMYVMIVIMKANFYSFVDYGLFIVAAQCKIWKSSGCLADHLKQMAFISHKLSEPISVIPIPI